MVMVNVCDIQWKEEKNCLFRDGLRRGSGLEAECLKYLLMMGEGAE